MQYLSQNATLFRWRTKWSHVYSTSKQSSELTRDAASDDQCKSKDSDKTTGNKKIYNLQTLHTTNLSSKQSYIDTPQRNRRAQNECYIFTQLSLIVVTFILGYMPTAIYQVWTIESRSNTEIKPNADYWFGVVSYLCLRFSECLNPIIYNLGSGKIRKATKKLLKLDR